MIATALFVRERPAVKALSLPNTNEVIYTGYRELAPREVTRKCISLESCCPTPVTSGFGHSPNSQESDGGFRQYAWKMMEGGRIEELKTMVGNGKAGEEKSGVAVGGGTIVELRGWKTNSLLSGASACQIRRLVTSKRTHLELGVQNWLNMKNSSRSR